MSDPFPIRFTEEENAALCRECGGRCCHTIPYTHSMVDIQGFVDAGDVGDLTDSEEEAAALLEEFRFIAANWRQIPILQARQTATYDVDEWSTEEGASHYYMCTRFDPQTLQCTAYESRPPNCRGFPFFGDPDPEESADFLGCLLVDEARRRLRNQRRSRRQR